MPPKENIRDRLADLFRAHGMEVAVWETTTDVGLASFFCLLAERSLEPLRPRAPWPARRPRAGDQGMPGAGSSLPTGSRGTGPSPTHSTSSRTGARTS